MAKGERLKKRDGFYTVDELINHRISYRERETKLINNLLEIMFSMVGKTYEWAKSHDKADLHICDIISIPKKTKKEFEEIVVQILHKQLGYRKERCRTEYGWFSFNYGLQEYVDQENDKEHAFDSTEDEVKERIRERIKRYEKNNGELHYDDGFENELKQYCNFFEK